MSSTSCPDRPMTYPAEPPPADPRSGPGRPRRLQRPHLGAYDALIHLLLSEPNTWRVVDAMPIRMGASSVYAALYRRGFDVTVRVLDGEKVVWARWPYPVPEWVVTSSTDDREITATATTSDPNWHQLSMWDDES